jgi:hypothetical protein
MGELGHTSLAVVSSLVEGSLSAEVRDSSKEEFGLGITLKATSAIGGLEGRVACGRCDWAYSSASASRRVVELGHDNFPFVVFNSAVADNR